MSEAKAAPPEGKPVEVEARLAGGIYALNRFLSTVQNKRMPVGRLEVSMDRESTRAAFALDCPKETARRYMVLLEGLEDVREVGEAEG